jgi:hypothetical protein
MLVGAVVLGAEQRVRTAFANRLAVEIEEMIPDEFFGFHALALTVPDSGLTGGRIHPP